MSVPYDPGLQPERTLLAWRRTCLAFGLASMVAVRFTVESIGFLAVVIGVIGAGLSGAAYFAASTVYRRVHDELHRSDSIRGNGIPYLLAVGAALVLGGAVAIYIVMSAMSGETWPA